MGEETVVYVCVRCLTPAGEPGECTYCGGKRVGCKPGDPDDPCRRPLVDEGGQIRTRAPLWWLVYTVPELVKYVTDMPEDE